MKPVQQLEYELSWLGLVVGRPCHDVLLDEFIPAVLLSMNESYLSLKLTHDADTALSSQLAEGLAKDLDRTAARCLTEAIANWYEACGFGEQPFFIGKRQREALVKSIYLQLQENLLPRAMVLIRAAWEKASGHRETKEQGIEVANAAFDATDEKARQIAARAAALLPLDKPAATIH